MTGTALLTVEDAMEWLDNLRSIAGEYNLQRGDRVRIRAARLIWFLRAAGVPNDDLDFSSASYRLEWERRLRST